MDLRGSKGVGARTSEAQYIYILSGTVYIHTVPLRWYPTCCLLSLTHSLSCSLSLSLSRHIGRGGTDLRGSEGMEERGVGVSRSGGGGDHA